MAKENTEDLNTFLSVFDESIREKVFWLREFVWDLYPEANELIYDNYNAVAFGWSITDKLGDLFCNIAVGRSSKNIQFGFYWGSKLADVDSVLLGKGNQYRYILVKSMDDFPKEYIKKLLDEAYNYSFEKMKNKIITLKGATITKSISEKKRK
ncbi:hypothetical protein [Runella sp.]|jgi:hypothetical protein|uniref:hypothetical protein n=1 Tax=Runella sp. TaxID=1960881 RepID=UPI003018C9FF